MKALVSGGTGYVGGFIVKALREAGHEVTAPGQEIPLDAKFDYAPLFENVDTFIHCAFEHVSDLYRGGEGDDPQGFVRKNRDGSIAMFEAAKVSGVSHAVFTSSRAVYGDQPAGQELFEITPSHPNTLYGEVKLTVENAISGLASEAFRTTSLRCTGVYDQTKWTGLAADYLVGKPIAPRVGTEVHGEDVGQAVLCILKHGEHRLYNVSDILVDRADILAPIQRAKNCPHPLPERADMTGINAMNNDRLRSIGWQPGGGGKFEETIRNI